MIRVATLFSGVGTPEQSLKHLKVEHETVFACEIDKYARITYLANNQEPKTFYDDVYNIDGNIYKDQVDILIGGSPCQSFSIAGKRMGTSCPRGNLIYEYFRIVEEAKPKVFIYENVKGFLSIDKIDKKEKYGETFKNFVQSFKDLGYTIYYEILNTKDYGVPQNRERIYIVGFRDEVKFEFAPKEELKLRLKDMLDDEVDEKYLLSDKLVSYFEKHKEEQNKKGNGFGWQPLDKNTEVSFTITNPGKTRPNETYIKLQHTHTLNIKGNDSIKRIYSSDGLCPSLTTMQGGHREPKVAIEKEIIKLFDIPKEILNDNERQRRVYSPEGISPAVIARSDSAKILQNTKSKIAHPVREVGRRLDTDGKRCDDNKDIPITRRYEIGDKEISNCLSGVQKDSYVAIEKEIIKLFDIPKEILNDNERQRRIYSPEGISPAVIARSDAAKILINGLIEVDTEVRVKEATKLGYKIAEEGDSINISVPSSKTRRGRAGKQVAQTLDTACNQVVFNKKFIFRKLTPRECFRLQGFDDSFIFPPKMSDTQLYKQAGNGMSRNILDMIFTQIFKSKNFDLSSNP